MFSSPIAMPSSDNKAADSLPAVMASLSVEYKRRKLSFATQYSTDDSMSRQKADLTFRSTLVGDFTLKESSVSYSQQLPSPTFQSY